jgi:hypothetical protein
MPSILIAGVSQTGDVAMAFASCMLALQNELFRHPTVEASFDIVDSLNDALLKFKNDPRLDMLVAVDTKHSIDPKFCLEADDKDFVVGVYPTGIDWERVESKMATTTEEADGVGNKYNVQPSKGKFMGGTQYIQAKSAGLRIVKIKRKVLDTIAATHPEVGDALHADGVVDGTFSTADARFCALWGGDVWASLRHKASAQVNMVYGPGSVASRAKIR